MYIVTEGAAVRDADDCGRLHLQTDLDPDGLRAALTATGSGESVGGEDVWLYLGVLRARAELVAAAPDWAQRWTAMVDHAARRGRLSPDGRAVQVNVRR